MLKRLIDERNKNVEHVMGIVSVTSDDLCDDDVPLDDVKRRKKLLHGNIANVVELSVADEQDVQYYLKAVATWFDQGILWLELKE